MKKLNKALSVFLLVMLFAMFSFGSACKKDEEPASESNSVSDSFESSDNASVSEEPVSESESVDYTDDVLADNGTTGYSIVISESASATVQSAAVLVKNQFKEATGATIEVVKSDKSFNENDKVISIGNTKILSDAVSAKKITEPLTEENLNRHGYIIRTLGKTVVIAGANEWGDYYGSLEFLYRQFGYEMFAHDETYINYTPRSVLIDFNVKDVPSFASRGIDGYTQSYSEYSKQLRINSSEALGAVKEVPGDCHTIYKYFVPNGYSTYTDAKDGEDDSKANSLCFGPKKGNDFCLTSKYSYYYALKSAKEFLIENPDADFLNISQEDTGELCRGQENKAVTGCTCENDRAKYHSSGMWIRFCNKIIVAIEEWKKDPMADVAKQQALFEQEKAATGYACFDNEKATFAVPITAEQAEKVKAGHWNYETFAYGGVGGETFNAPVINNADGTYTPIDNTIIPDGKLYMKIAPLERMCLSHAFDDENCDTNASLMAQLKAWQSLTHNFNTWSYNVNYSDYLMWYPYLNGVQNNARVYKNIGVYSYFIQSCTNNKYSVMSPLYNYLYAKTAWDVNANLGELTDRFLERYYRDAAPAIKKYIDYMNTVCTIKEQHLGNYQGFDARFYDGADLDRAMAYIEEAFLSIEKYEQSDPSLYEKLKKRITYDKICIRHCQLNGYATYYDISTVRTQGMKWYNEMKEDLEYLGTSFNYAEAWYKTMEKDLENIFSILNGLM